MSPDWSLSMALGSLDREIWSTTPFAAVGLVQPASGGLVTFELRTPVAIGCNDIDRKELEPGRAINQILRTWNLGPLTAVPIGSTGAELFACLTEDRPIARDGIALLTDLARRVDTVARAGEPRTVREQRLTRTDALAGVLRALSTALDIREVFGELSAMTRSVLPHDSSIVGLHVGDHRRVRFHALNVPEDWNVPEVIDNPYPNTLSEHWNFSLYHDMTQHPVERLLTPAQRGVRSSIRTPIRLNGKPAGVLAFGAFQPNQYTDADLPIARRVADYIALALQHQQLADEARTAAAVRERAANLEMLDALLRTLAGALDVRDVFGRVSEICDKVMTHDAMSISIPSEDRERVTVHVATGALSSVAIPYDMPVPERRLVDEHWDFKLIDDLSQHPEFLGGPSVGLGLRGMLSIPVWVERRLRASVNFFSRTPGHFTNDDVLVGRKIADHIALALSHQRLAEQSRQNVELRARAANIELLDELLATVGDSGDLSNVFDRISAVARRVLPHDMLALPVLLGDGEHVRVYARSGIEPDAIPDVAPVPPAFVANDDWEYDLVDDVQADPGQRNLEAAKRGYRAVLRIPIRFEGTFAAALAFLSREPSVYRAADVPVARRIADRVALLLARERGVEAVRRADEAAACAAKLEARVRALTEELDTRTGYRRVVGESASWRQVLTQATQVAGTDATVLLLGESGTGKEVVARFVHRASSRANGPFLALNCAALPEQLLEAELFGYERGAYTGATQSKPGQLEQAAGGTLFLDEVGEMSPQAQAKFLRVLQEREFQRLGGTRVLRTDARIVAATNRDLARAIEQGTFREDLFYRLNVFAIKLPPLRERRDDILPLSEAFLSEIGRSIGRPPTGISKDARGRLVEHRWPGNVRELRNILERAAILADGGLITAEHLALMAAARSGMRPAPSAMPPAQGTPQGAGGIPERAGDLASMERRMIEHALQKARFNKSKAAKALGLTRAQLYARMRRYGLE